MLLHEFVGFSKKLLFGYLRDYKIYLHVQLNYL